MKTALLCLFYLSSFWAQPIYALTESTGEAPKSNRQKQGEAERNRKYQQEQWRKKKAEEEQKRAEEKKTQAENERRKNARGKYLNEFSEYPLMFSGEEPRSELEQYFNPEGNDGEPILAALRSRREGFIDRWVVLHPEQADSYQYIRENLRGTELSQVIHTALKLSPEEKLSLAEAMHNTDDISAFLAWHKERVSKVNSVITRKIQQQYAEIKDAKYARIRDALVFWRGVTLGVGGNGELKEKLPNNRFYADLNLLFWGFLRFGPYITTNPENISRYGLLTEFVIGSPRVALLLGGRAGYASAATGSGYKPTVTPGMGLEFALGLPVSLVFRYEYEVQFRGGNQYDFGHQYNVLARFRLYNDYYFSRGEMKRRDVDGPFWNRMDASAERESSTKSLLLGAHWLFGSSRNPQMGMYTIGFNLGRSQITALSLEYGFMTEGKQMTIQGHLPTMAFDVKLAGWVLKLAAGPLIRKDLPKPQVVLPVIWPQVGLELPIAPKLLARGSFGYLAYFGGDSQAAQFNQFTLGLTYSYLFD